MAKTTKKTTKFTVASLLTQKPQELADMLHGRKLELVEKRRSLHAGELANPHSITRLRREIAVLKTIMHQQSSATAPEKEEK